MRMRIGWDDLNHVEPALIKKRTTKTDMLLIRDSFIGKKIGKFFEMLIKRSDWNGSDQIRFNSDSQADGIFYHNKHGADMLFGSRLCIGQMSTGQVGWSAQGQLE